MQRLTAKDKIDKQILLISPKKAELMERQKSSKRESGMNIYDKLYQQKEQYFEHKRTGNRDSKLESEFKECTFSPNASKKRDSNRSFNRLYEDIMSA